MVPVPPVRGFAGGAPAVKVAASRAQRGHDQRQDFIMRRESITAGTRSGGPNRSIAAFAHGSHLNCRHSRAANGLRALDASIVTRALRRVV